jgi:ribose 5-phosphate isomerase A
LKHLKALGSEPQLRRNGDQPYVSENGNLTADCKFQTIEDPVHLDAALRSIPGVVATGLFANSMVTMVIAGYADGRVVEINPHE